MVFIIIVIFAIGLYIWGYKIPALFIFFFFLTSGFNLIPEEIMELKLFSKGMDYAIILIIAMVIIDSLCIKNYLKPDKLIWLVLIFFAFLISCIAYNKFVIGIGWKEIIRTARYNVLWIGYLVFRNLSKEQLHYLLKSLFFATVICAALYILQIVIDEHILNKSMKVYIRLSDVKIPRFYNQPDMLHFFTFMAIYLNPCKGMLKIVTTIILVVALLGALHRSLFMAFILAISIGYIIRLPRSKRVAILTSISIICFVFIVFWGYKFAKSRTVKDLALVTSVNVTDVEATDIDIEELQKSTFTFRVAHFLERNQYVLEHPKAMLFGAGLMTEDSKSTDAMFDFKVGLIEEALVKTTQLDTGDISYSILIMRYGYVGTIFVVALFIFFTSYFYKNHEDPVGLFSLAYLIVVLVTSFFSYLLVLPMTFVLPLISYSIIQKSKL